MSPPADCPRMRLVDIDFALTIILNALVPPSKELMGVTGVTAKIPHMVSVVDGTSSFRARKESPKAALHNIALLGETYTSTYLTTHHFTCT